MTQSASYVLAQLVTIFPPFLNAWESPENYSRSDDGSFTHHGLFLEFTAYYRTNYRSFSAAQLRSLAEKLNDWFGGPNGDLDNAVATCFLENIAGEPGAQDLEPLLKNEAREFMHHWKPTT